MPRYVPPKDELIDTAAELRAGGASWDAVAAAVGRAADTVRRWPRAYPGRWQAAYRAAERQLLTEAAAESVLTLRKQLRSDDERAGRDAADKLLKHRAAGRPRRRTKPKRAVPARAVRLAEYVHGLTDDQLDALIAELDAAPAGGGETRTGGPAGGDRPD